jgi:putative NADH-flavin reductase
VLADKASPQFVMKDGLIVAAGHAGSELPKELFTRKHLMVD